MKSKIKPSLESVIHKIKTGKVKPLLIVPFGTRKLCITPVTYDHLKSERYITMLARWRDDNKQWFPTQFTVTFEGTRYWLKEKVLDDKDRILFFVHFKGDDPFAHAGFDRWQENSRAWSIDNVLRGNTPKGSKGAMSVALKAIMEWAYSELHVDRLSLMVFDDNNRAKKLYSGVGFTIIKKEPLIERTENDITVWKTADDIGKARRFHTHMIHDKKSI